MKNSHRYYLIRFILFLFTGLISFNTYATTPYSQIVFFGDSLTDNGNLYRDLLGLMPKSPPYFNGQFSNGEIWSEYIAKHYHDSAAIKSVNYAVGGETAVLHNPAKGFLPYTLTMSLDNYLLHTAYTDKSGVMYIIWIGANDYLPGVDNIDELTTKVINAIKSTVDSLIYHGGKNFLIINLPDLSLTPAGRSSNYGDVLKAASMVHNLKLDQAVTDIQSANQGVNLHLYNINSLLDAFIENPDEINAKYQTHISNQTESCWEGGYTLNRTSMSETDMAKQIDQYFSKTANRKTAIDSKGLAHYIATTPDLLEAFYVAENKALGATACADPDSYAFWDHVHPTAVTHNIIAQELASFIDENYVPVTPKG